MQNILKYSEYLSIGLGQKTYGSRSPLDGNLLEKKTFFELLIDNHFKKP